jgi:hypothetical protein
MTDPAAAARAKIAALKAEIARLEDFLALYEELSSAGKKVNRAEALTVVSGQAMGNETPQLPVDKSVDNQRRKRRNGARPDQFADHMERIIREVGRPMTRGEIVAAMERRDILIPYEDKGRYLGTIAWRHKRRFKNVEGRGYWVADLPIPPIEAVQANFIEDEPA